jgi:spore germination cell wall hydrolase CwlJ-like protein
MTSAMCIALAIYFESASSNQPVDDQYGIALVIRNRVQHSGMTPCDVVFANKQFSSLNDALDDDGNLKPEYRPQGKAWTTSKAIAQRVLRGEMPDFTNGARYYYANYITPPAWIQGMKFTGRHGKHLYWKRPKRHPSSDGAEAKLIQQSPTIASNESFRFGWN